jgi:hypothetical protein
VGLIVADAACGYLILNDWPSYWVVDVDVVDVDDVVDVVDVVDVGTCSNVLACTTSGGVASWLGSRVFGISSTTVGTSASGDCCVLGRGTLVLMSGTKWRAILPDELWMSAHMGAQCDRKCCLSGFIVVFESSARTQRVMVRVVVVVVVVVVQE